MIGAVAVWKLPPAALLLLAQPTLGPLALPHDEGRQGQPESREEVAEPHDRPAPPGQGGDQPRLLEDLAHRGHDLVGLQQLAGEGERGAGVVELVVEHRRPDAVGADARDVHVLDLGCPQVGHGAQAEPHDGVLRGGVDPLAGHGGEAGERGDVDDLATAVGTHRLDGGQRAVHRPDRIHLDHQAALLLVVLPRGAGEEHAGVVDPDVQSTGDGDDPIARGTHGRVVTDVERESRRWLAELARHLLRRRLVEVGDEHPVAPLHEKAGDLPPQAAAGAGDDHHADVVVLVRPLERFRQGPAHAGGVGVQLLGPVQADGQDRPVLVDEQGFIGHALFSLCFQAANTGAPA